MKLVLFKNIRYDAIVPYTMEQNFFILIWHTYMKTNQFLKLLKPIFSSIKYSPKMFALYFLVEIFDWFQSVFVVVIMASVISAIEAGNIDWLYFWSWVFIIIGIIKIVFSLFWDSLYICLLFDIKVWLSKKYLHEYILFDNTKVEEYWTGKMNNIIFSWISSIWEIIKLSISIFVELFAIIYIFILVLLKVPNIYYFVWFILLFALIIYLYGKWLSQIVKIRKKSKELSIQQDSRKVKILMSKFEILQNQKIDHETQEIGKIYWELKNLSKYWNFKKNLWQMWSDIIIQFFYVIIFLVIWIGIIHKQYDIATFTLLVWILQILWRYAWQIRSYMRDVLKEFINIEKLLEIFEIIPKYKDYSHLPDFHFLQWDIHFKNIHFSYTQKTDVFNNFSLDLIWWKRYAFVWPSWWWKSTLVKLIAGYINPDKWEIIVDNQNLSWVKLKTFYNTIGYLSQDPWVFDGTILENLLYALNYVPVDEKINEVIKLSKCEYIYQLPYWLQTQIWEKWVKLSWWQKQRLAIAKIMLKNPNIILLDEPTSALDSFNEEEVSIAFNNLFTWKTVIVVAHRLQTVKNSHMIFYLENGEITESGTHNDLINQKWKYYKMIELQSWF